MASIFICSENESIAKELIAAGRSFTGDLSCDVCVVAINSEDPEALIGSGADKVYQLTGGNQSSESYADGLAALMEVEQPVAVLMGATQKGKDLAAKVAAKNEAGLVTEAFSVRVVEGKVETDRMMYGGLAICTEILALGSLVTVPARTFEALEPDSSRQGEVIMTQVKTDDRVRVNSISPIVREGADISVADKLVCVGRGLAKQEDMKLAEEMATAMTGEICCTRGIAEDYHWLPIERYVGLSGQRVKPSIYLSLGVSGQVQHVAGIRDSKIIVAVDTNENAPIFEAADYGIVGDLYEIAPTLTEAIKAAN